MDVNLRSLYEVRSWYSCDLPGLAFLSPNLILLVNLLHPHVSAKYESLTLLIGTKSSTQEKKRHYSLDCPDEETIENLVYRSLTQDKHVKCDISAQTINAIQGGARQLC